MPNIKIAHESPVFIIENIAKVTNIDYCLVHLMDKNEKYKNYFVNARNLYNREVYLDCSIFELGEAYNLDRYVHWAQQIKPSVYIVPDVLENSSATIESYKKFESIYGDSLKNLDSQKMGVIQGKTWQELVDCYKFMDANADILALSFDLSYFLVTGEGRTDFDKYGSGRKRFIEQLISAGIWNKNKFHHMLGTMAPQHLHWIKSIPGIYSVDTANPVLHGMFNIQYNSTFGLKSKNKTKLADMIDYIPSADQQNIIYYNIEQFNKIING